MGERHAEEHGASHVPDEGSQLVAHARRELELIGEEPTVIDWYLRLSCVSELRGMGTDGSFGMRGSARPTVGRGLR